MAGTIILADRKGVPMDGFTYEYFSDLIRAGFRVGEEEVRDKVFWHQDEGGMSLIYAAELNSGEFCSFASAVVEARNRARSEENFEYYAELWSELIELVKEDVRGSGVDIEWN